MIHTNFCIRYIVYNLTGKQKPRLAILVGDFKQYYIDVYFTLFSKTHLIRVLNKNIYAGTRLLAEPFFKKVN